MKHPSLKLIKKELNSSFLTASGLLTALLFVLLSSTFLWLLPGEYNLLQNGYAEFANYFRLLFNLLIFLTPVWTMRSYAEEYRSGTWELLESRPIGQRTILASKTAALWLGLGLCIGLTALNMGLASALTPASVALDGGAIASSYLGLLLCTGVFISLGTLASACVRHSIGAVLLGIALNAFWAYGWDWIQMVPLFAKTGLLYALSLSAQSKGLFTGVIDSRALIFFALLIGLTFETTILLTNKERNRGIAKRLRSKRLIAATGALLLLWGANQLLFLRLDCTADKRFSLKAYTLQTIGEMKQPIRAQLFLDGELNSGFLRLKQATIDLIDECNQAGGQLYYSISNPFRYGVAPQHKSLLQQMQNKGVGGIALNEKDAEGKVSQKQIFPYLMLTNQRDTVWVSLLVNNPQKNGSENLNTSIEELEYRLVDGLHRLAHPQSDKIAFIEGHGEEDEPYVSDALDRLSQTYQVDRGSLPDQPETLSSYKALVVVAPQTPFTESEKFILDHYLQQGGSLLLAIEPAKLSRKELFETGKSTAIAIETGLSDLLFRYGLRLRPSLVQDVQCATLPVRNQTNSEFIPAPWYYAPVLFPTDNHLLTRNLPPLRAEFCGSLEWIGEQKEVKRTVLYQTSNRSRTLSLPNQISLADVSLSPDQTTFGEAPQTVVALIEGILPSPYTRRPSPIDGTIVHYPNPQKTKLIIAAGGNLFRNEVEADAQGHPIVHPLGLDRYTQTTYGNGTFLTNALHYLTGRSELMQLRERQITLRTLDKTKTLRYGTWIQLLSIVIPVAVLGIVFGTWGGLRKRRYKK